MKTVCNCGFDCTEFVAQHMIPDAARFACPVCEVSLYAVDHVEAIGISGRSPKAGPPAQAPLLRD